MLTMPELLDNVMSYVELVLVGLDAVNGLDVTIFEPGLETAAFPFDYWARRPDFSSAMPGW